MRIRVWNAYASNNSGSYTIVVALPSEEVARDVAAELATMIDAHTRWHDAWNGTGDTAASPLAAFCRTHGLSWSTHCGGADEWPDYAPDNDNRPRVAAVGRQVIVHHDYTVTLPATFGEYFYKRGGRVQHEENHAHHPLVVIAAFYWGWTAEAKARMAAEQPRLVAALTAADGPLATLADETWPPALRQARDTFHDWPITVGVIFGKLIEGVSALRVLAEAHGADLSVRLHEAPDETHDPLAFLRAPADG